MKKSVFFVFVLICLSLSLFVGCDKKNLKEEIDENVVEVENIEQEKEYIDTIKIPFDTKDTLNPYTLKTEMNSKIMPLVFDSLIKTDINLKSECVLAKSISKSNNTVIISLKDNLFFNDGSKITADDVVNSFDLAKSSENFYSYNLRKILSSKKIDEKTVSFETENLNQLYQNLFSFPIVKKSGDDLIGSGRYIFSKENGKDILVPSQNPIYKAESYPIKKILLVPNSSKSTDGFKINMGEIDLSYVKLDLNKNKTLSIPYVTVPTNKLIYLGINSNNGFFSNNEARKALTETLDVSKIRGYVSLRGEDYKSGFLNPQFYRGKEFEQNLLNAKARLDKIGFKINKSGETRKGLDNKPIVLKLVVNSENEERNLMAEEIKRQLFDVGIEINIVSLPFEEYLNALKNNNFDLYIAEIGIGSDMDLEPVLAPFENSGFGTTLDSKSFKSNVSYKNGSIDEKQLSLALMEDIPFVPIAYRDDLLYCKENFAPYIVATCDDIFYNILSWNLKSSN